MEINSKEPPSHPLCPTQTVRYILVIWQVYMFLLISTCAISAWKRRCSFIGGSDEHGVPITIRAKKEGITPQDVVDRYHTLIKESFKEFGISFDIYSRTTSKTHHELASEFFKPCMIKVSSLKRPPCNITTKKPISSWPTVILPVNVLTAMQKEPTVTNARSAEHHFLRPTWSIRKCYQWQ